MLAPEEISNLVLQYRPGAVALARRLARGLSRPIDDDDLVSIALEALWVSATKYDSEAHPDVKFWSYAYNNVRWVVLTTIRDHLRRNIQRSDLDFSTCAEPIVKTPSFGELVEVLDGPDRELLTRRYVLGQTLEEIGRLAGVSRQRVKQVEQRALARLRHHYSPLTPHG